MKKIFKYIGLVLIVIIIGLLLFFHFVPNYIGNEGELKDKDIESSANWMGKINDKAKITSLLIPGTHDSGSKFCQLSYFSKCQGMDIESQLLSGYRYLDIRLGIKDNDLIFYHGPTKCKETPFGSILTAEKVLSVVEEFLDKHPTETVILNIKKENGNESEEKFDEILESKIKQKYLYKGKELPTVGEARGKIILAKRHSSKKGIELIWKEQPGSNTNDNAYIEYDNLVVQDHYEYESGAKWKAFMKSLEYKGEKLMLNFLSTKGKSKLGHPKKYADVLNENLKNSKISDDAKGCIILDYATSKLAKQIYEVNFKKYKNVN